jgi:hypothetical protein
MDVYGRAAPHRESEMLFIGEEHHATIAAYWFEVMRHTLPRLADRDRISIERRHQTECFIARMEAKTTGAAPRRSGWTALRGRYLFGCVLAIGRRLKDRLREDEAATAPASGREVVLSHDAAISAWIADHLGRTGPRRTSKDRPVTDVERLGYRSGLEVGLHDGIAQAARPSPLAIDAAAHRRQVAGACP